MGARRRFSHASSSSNGTPRAASAGASVRGRLSVTTKTDPWPGVLRTVMSPPIMRASVREISRPRPEPPTRRRSELSAW